MTNGRIIIAAAALLLGCNRAGASEPTNPGRPTTTEERRMNDIESLKQVEQTWVNSLTTGDAKLLSTIIDKQFTFIGPDGQVEERDAYLGGYAEMSKLGVVVESIDVSEVKFRVLDEVGIVTGHVVAKVKMQGTPIVENVRFTRVYRRSGDGWQMIAGQGTRITEGPPPKG